MRALTFVLALASFASAYRVLIPNPSQGWTDQGAQPLTWERVSTDRENFTVVLDNQSVRGFSPQVLAALVDGTLGRTSLNPPSGGWPTGGHFRVNLVQDTNNLNSIYAQSGEFNISSPSSSSSTRSTAVQHTSTSTDSTADPTDTSSVIPPSSQSGGALATNAVNAGVLALLSLLAYALA